MNAKEFITRQRGPLVTEVTSDAIKDFIMQEPLPHIDAVVTADWNNENTPHFRNDREGYEVKFNAAPWFQTAQLELIVDLARKEYGACEAADAVALGSEEPAMVEFMDNVYGYEVYVDRKQAEAFLRENRPDAYAILERENLIGE